MSGHQSATINDTIYFWFAANDTSGSGGDGATPLYDVREAGEAAGAAPLLSGTPALLTGAAYPAGCHEIAVAATTGNGFAADDTFAVFCTLAVDSQNPSGFVGSCTLTPLAKEAKQDIIDTNIDTLISNQGDWATATGFATSTKQDTMETTLNDVPTTAEFNARTILAASYFDPAVDAVANVTLTATCGTLTGHTPQTGDSFPLISNISIGSAAISTRADSGTVVVGTVIGGTTYTNTFTLDGNYHSVADDAGNLNVEYQFDVGGNGVAVEVVMDGYFSGNGDILSAQAYNFVNTTWEPIGTLVAASGTDNQQSKFNLDVQHTGTSGADLGIVKIRGYEAAGGLSSVQLNIDRAFMSYSIVAQSVGYANGRIWINTVNGIAGTESYVNGTADNKVLTLADAITINNNLNLGAFNCSPDSTITFAESHINEIFEGQGWALALGGQNISQTHIHHANNVTGIATSPTGECHILDSHLGAVTIGECHITRCSFSSTFIASAAGDYTFSECESGVQGAGVPTSTFTGLGSASTMSIRGWKGGGEWVFDANCTASISVLLGGTHTVTTGGGDIEFRGTPKALIVNTSGTGTTNIIVWSGCPITINGTGGTVNVYGVHDGITDNSTGATVTEFGQDITQIAEMAGSGFNTSTDSLEAIRNNTGTAGAGLTDLGGMSTAMRAQVNAECDTALADYDGPTNAEMIARTLLAANYFDPTTDTVVASNMVSEPDNASIAAILTDTNVTLPAQIAALLVTAMTESYAADGAAPTVEQCLFAIQQWLQERVTSGTSVEVKRLDGITKAMVFTLDDAVTPTSITRDS